MNVEQCNMRAAQCAANAAESPTEALRLEFLKLAGQWRAMAVRQIFLGHVGEFGAALNVLKALPKLPF
jgi:hypothetical protein